MSTSERIIKILKKLSGKNEISENDTLVKDLALDSLEMVMLLIDIEEEFLFELEESDMNPFKLQKVADVITLCDKYIKNNKSFLIQ